MRFGFIRKIRSVIDAPVNMTEGPILPAMLLFALPIMMGTLLQQLYATVDTIILGRFVGKTAIAAVGGSDAILIYLLVDFFVGVCSGASIIVSQYYGAEDAKGVQKSIRTAMILSAVIGAFCTVAGILIAPRCLVLLDTPAETMQYSRDYLVWYFAGMVPSMVYNMGSSILRATGDSRRPLYFLIFSCGLNVILDLVFVVGLKLEVRGAAMATSLSQLICSALILRSIFHPDIGEESERSDWIPDGTLIRTMVLLGVPMGLQSSLYNVTNLFITKAVNRLSTDAIAAWAIQNKFDAFFWPAGNAIAIAVMTFVGQNYGARKAVRIRGTVRCGIILYASCAVAYSILILSIGPSLVPLFSGDPNVAAYLRQFLYGISWGYVCFTLASILPSAMRGTGNTLKPAIITFFGACLLRLIILFTYTFPHLSPASICICYPPTWALTSLLFLIYYKFFPWMPPFPESQAAPSGECSS